MGHVALVREMRSAYIILITKPEGNRPLGKSGRRLEDNIRMDGRDIAWERVDFVPLAQYTDQWRSLVNTIMNLRVP